MKQHFFRNNQINNNQANNQVNKQNAYKQFLWSKNYNLTHLTHIKNIHFFIHPYYENDNVLKYQLPTLIHFFRALCIEVFGNHIQFITVPQIFNNFDTLYILLNHRELHNFIGNLPNIFVLVNTLDFYDNSFIFPQNLMLYSKAYKIIDTKYINLQYYIPEVKNYTYYLPLICNYNNTKPSKIKESNDILIYKNNTKRSMMIYKLLCKKIEVDGKYTFQTYDHNGKLEEELFYESKIIVRIHDEENSYYDNILFHKCIYHNKICISEKSNDIYNENYYFDKILFENKINIFDENTINKFIQKIYLYLEDKEKINILKTCMNNENYIRNINQCKLIFDKY